MSSQKIKTAKTNLKLYRVVVTDMDKIEKRVKIHYVEYSERSSSGGHAIMRIATLLFSGWNLFVFLLVLLLRTPWN